MALAHRLTQCTKFATFTNPAAMYPTDPAAYVKIAVFGSSAAAGYNAERGFTEILTYELNQRYPRLKFYVKNYARNGYPFHRHEAELLKKVMKYYDICLIYAGNNEAWNYIDDIGYFRTAEHKHEKSFVPLPVDVDDQAGAPIIAFLESRSRLYAIMKKAALKVQGWASAHLKRPESARRNQYRAHWFNEFEPQGVVPPEEMAKVAANFEHDLRAIARLAQQHGTEVIISSVPTDTTYPPHFSVVGAGLSEQALDKFHELRTRGVEQYRRQEFSKALASLLAANAIDDDVAIVKYLIGQCYLRMGRVDEGRRFIQEGLDADGLPFRSFSALHQRAEAVAQQSASLHYIDSVKPILAAVDRGLRYDELFSDLQHPSFLGHLIIAHQFLCAMAALPLLDAYPSTEGCLDVQTADLRTLAARYKGALGVSKEEEHVTAYMKSRWHLGVANLSAYSEEYLGRAETYVNQTYMLSPKTVKDEVTQLIFLAMIEGKRGHLAQSVRLANQALHLSPEITREVLSGVSVGGEAWLQVFNDMGIAYAENGTLFAVRQGY